LKENELSRWFPIRRGSWVDGIRQLEDRSVYSRIKSVYEIDFEEGEFFSFGKMGWVTVVEYENGGMEMMWKEEIRPDVNSYEATRQDNRSTKVIANNKS
jgi:hypothetical protein